MQPILIVLVLALALPNTVAAGPVAPACYACVCDGESREPRYCRLIEEQNDFPGAFDECTAACSGSSQFPLILEGNFCPSPPCESHGAPAMSQRVLVLTAVTLLLLGVLFVWGRRVRT